MIEKILEERGSRYGEFIDVASATVAIQEAVYAAMNVDKLRKISPDHGLALDMICHKLARIAVGDINYVDSWVDIAGYATLVAERLKGTNPSQLSFSSPDL